MAVLGLIYVARGISRAAPAGQSVRRGLLLYGGGVLVALYLHTTMVALPLVAGAVFVALWAGCRDRSWRVAGLFVAVNVVCAIAWGWWLWMSLRQMAMPRPNFGWMTQPQPVTALAIATWTLMPRSPQFLAGLAPLALFLPALAGAWQLRGDRRIILLGFLIGPALLLYGLGFISPVLTPRTLLWATFAASISLAAACCMARSRVLRLGVPALLVVFACWHGVEVSAQRDREPWREIVSHVAQEGGRGGVLLFKDDSIGLILDYYCRKDGCPFERYRILADSDGTERWAEGLWTGRKITLSELAGLFARPGEVWAVRRTFSNPAPELWGLATEEFWRGPPLATMPDNLQVTPWRRSGTP